ncbi:hypothetical protein HXX76_004414 [Chlamydomonas incerta]|uniref:Uncharacterized protein n=1 Tax=Chlamydomonas incerta TaxID=51695 RepID=A0A835T7T9_CHLIN|nr:hypothetical protein HXX76_004414 [Chlamydomonas incerta]|eukprot:KAG2440303.1 hypothetical protein HXX76_004414 [Chlamydomonas incerta]
MPPELKQQLAQERGAVAGGEEPLEPHGNGEDVNAGASSTSGGPPRGASRRILESAALDDGFSFSFSTLASTTGGVSSVARPFSSATGAPTAGGSAYGVGGSSACQSYQQQQLMPDSAGTGRGVARLPPSTAALVAAAKLRGTGQSSSAAGHRTWSAALSRESASSQQGPCDRVCGSSSGNSACCRSRRSRFSQEHERHMSAADVPLEAAAASGEQARCVLRGGAANQQPSMKANARTLAGLMHVRSPGETAIQAGLRGPYSDAPLALSPPQRLLGGEVQPERQQQPRPQWLHLQTLPLATVAASGGTATSNSGLFQGLVVKAEEVSKAASSSNAGLPSNVWGQALAAGLRVAPGVEEDEEDEAEAANAGDAPAASAPSRAASSTLAWATNEGSSAAGRNPRPAYSASPRSATHSTAASRRGSSGAATTGGGGGTSVTAAAYVAAMRLRGTTGGMSGGGGGGLVRSPSVTGDRRRPSLSRFGITETAAGRSMSMTLARPPSLGLSANLCSPSSPSGGAVGAEAGGSHRAVSLPAVSSFGSLSAALLNGSSLVAVPLPAPVISAAAPEGER